MLMLVLIRRDSGGTGASPLSSIKHAGIPWELGLAETQQTLLLNDLRSVSACRPMASCRPDATWSSPAAGAEEFGFATTRSSLWLHHDA